MRRWKPERSALSVISVSPIDESRLACGSPSVLGYRCLKACARVKG